MFFVVVIDEVLSWKLHITMHARKKSKSIGIIYRASFCLPISSLCTLYYSLVYPYLVYYISVWGSTYASNLNRIFLLQKIVIRIIYKSAFDAHTDPLFEQFKTLRDFITYINCKLWNSCFYLKMTFSLICSKKCFPKDVKFIHITQETQIRFTISLAEPT